MKLVVANTDHWAEKGVISASSEFRADLSRIFDIGCVAAGLIFAHYIRLGHPNFSSNELVVSLVFALLFHLTATTLGVYSQSQEKYFYKTIAYLCSAYAISLSILATGALLTHTSESFSRIWFVLGTSSALGLVILYRYSFRTFVRLGWTTLSKKRVLIVGSGDLGQEVANRIHLDPYKSSEIVGFISRDPKSTAVGAFGEVLGEPSDIELVLEQFRLSGNPVDRVFVALPARAIEEKLQLVNDLISTQYQVFVVPDYSLSLLTNSRSDNLYGLPVIDVSHSKLQGPRATIKSVMDLTLSLIGGLLLAPFLLLIAIAVKLESGGPILFKQRRYGIGGRVIWVFKFRTMKVVEDGFEYCASQER